jgi:putative FmdB family regulatory protein
MTTYHYKCKDCGAEFEFLVDSDKEKVECISCGSTKLIKTASKVADSDESGGCNCSGCPGCGH